MVRIAFMGDVMLAKEVTWAIENFGPEYPWGDTLPVLKSADLRIINLECVISNKGERWVPKTFNFRASPLAIDALKAAGIDVVSLANNHVLDYNEEALVDMLDRLDDAGIKRVGAGRDSTEARMPLVVDVEGLRVGIVSVTDSIPAWEAMEGRPGVNILRLFPSHTPTRIMRFLFHLPHTLLSTKRYIDRLKEEGCDLRIFSSHWGPNFVRYPNKFFLAYARMLMRCGMDVFYGHSAHIFQGVEVCRGNPIMYDTGDFVDDHLIFPGLDNHWSFIFLLDVGEDKRPERLSMVPVIIERCQARLATAQMAEKICGRMERLCREMGTPTRIEDGKVVIDL